MESPTRPQLNPLAMFMRQPKIYIRLPSKGEYWPEGSLETNETEEYPVYSMTAQDEMLLKIPDALMSGQAVVDVIQHCMPSIKNAWHTPSIDIDVILIAIRLATYGEMMKTPIKIGDVEMDYVVDLRTVMDSLQQRITWIPYIAVNDELTLHIRPVNYKQLSQAAIQTFETQKIIQLSNNEEMSEDDKVKLFKDSFSKLTNITIGTISSTIYKIDSSNGSTEDPEFIQEFINNVDKKVFDKIQKHIETLKEQNSVKPVTVHVTDEMRENGIKGETLEIPLIFDASNFFA
jgi:hypothetical protein